MFGGSTLVEDYMYMDDVYIIDVQTMVRRQAIQPRNRMTILAPNSVYYCWLHMQAAFLCKNTQDTIDLFKKQTSGGRFYSVPCVSIASSPGSPLCAMLMHDL